MGLDGWDLGFAMGKETGTQFCKGMGFVVGLTAQSLLVSRIVSRGVISFFLVLLMDPFNHGLTMAARCTNDRGCTGDDDGN